jgi:hypothetical protein
LKRRKKEKGKNGQKFPKKFEPHEDTGVLLDEGREYEE